MATDGMAPAPDPPEIPQGLETVPISADGFSAYADSDGVGRMQSHPGMRRDVRRLLDALGDVERDLQGTMSGQWMLGVRSSLSVIVQRDQQGYDAMGPIERGLDPRHLAPDALCPDQIEHTLAVDALDQVAHATQRVLYSQDIRWPNCPEHPQARVQPRSGLWICQNDTHEVAPIGQLSPPQPRRQLRPDGTDMEMDMDGDEDD